MSFALSVLLKTSFILGSAALLSAALRRSSASVRHLIWVAGMSAALVLPLISQFLPHLDLPVLRDSSAIAQSTDSLLKARLSGLFANPTVFAGPPKSDGYGSAMLAFLSQVTWAHRLLLVWSLGALITLGRSLFGIAVVWDLRRHSQTVTDTLWLSLLSRLQRDFRIANPVELRIGGVNIPPMTWGLFKQTVLLPAAAASWTNDRLELVLAHELAHVRRRDGLWQIIMQAGCSVYWFNPFVWYAAYRVRLERERAADDVVLNGGADADAYASHLLQIARGVASGWTLATLYMAHPSQLEARLRSIIDSRTNRRLPSRSGLRILLGSTVLMTLLTGAVHLTAMSSLPVIETLPAVSSAPSPSSSVTAEAAKSTTQTADTFRKWLDEEVVYIISDQERTAFMQLTSDAERNMFIEQFWLRRDPTPNTPENEFRQEHYNRIAYANQRFTSVNPGWKTDRGCIYILYGKPDEIDDHPSATYQRPAADGGGTVQTYPFQKWTYRYLAALGRYNVELEFVDTGRTGEYLLMMDPQDKSILKRPPSVRPQAAALSQPDSPESIANEYLRAGRYDDAIALFKSILTPEDPKKLALAYNNLGVAYLYKWNALKKQATKEDREAILLPALAAFSRCIELDPDMIWAVDSVVNVSYDLGIAAALETQSESVLRKKEDFSSTYTIAKVAFLQGNFLRANEFFARAELVNNRPDDPSLGIVHFNHAVALQRLGRDEGAIAQYLQAIRVNPSLFEADLNLANLYLSRGDKELARDRVNAILNMSPGNPAALALLRKIG
jgi:GWxTD domain-containing protein